MPRTLFWSLLTLAVIACCLPSTPVLGDEQDPPKAEEKEDDEKGAEEEEKDAKEKGAEEKDDKPADKEESKSADEEAEQGKEAEKKDDAKKDDVKKDEKKRKTYKVKPKPLKVEVTVSGTLASERMTEVELDAESWGAFEIEEIVPHGAKVRAGETLVRFDPEDLNEAIAELELSQRLSELSLMKMEEELPRLEEELERRLKDAQRAWEEEQEDYERYTETERDLVVKSQEMRLKQSKFTLDYAKDELEQLEKMYQADDLTEETEEMILRRQRTQMEFSKFSHEIAKYNHELVLNSSLPRQDERLKEMQRRVELALERVKSTTDLDLSRTRYELEQARNARRKSLEKHSEMIADKRLMTIKSPAAGVVYYGRCVNGKWGEIASLKQKLVVNKSVPKGTVMMTIIDPDDLCVLATIDEKDLPSVKQGQAAELSLTAEGVEPIDAKVASVDMVPANAGKFEISVDITGDTPDWLLPGMTGKAKIVTYEKKKAILVPSEAVHTDEDTDKKYVWGVEEEDDKVKVEKQWVKTGKTKGKEVEILSGLEQGDVISLESDEKGADDDEDDDNEEEED